jgi:hypothetical protein
MVIGCEVRQSATSHCCHQIWLCYWLTKQLANTHSELDLCPSRTCWAWIQFRSCKCTEVLHSLSRLKSIFAHSITTTHSRITVNVLISSYDLSHSSLNLQVRDWWVETSNQILKLFYFGLCILHWHDNILLTALWARSCGRYAIQRSVWFKLAGLAVADSDWACFPALNRISSLAWGLLSPPVNLKSLA